MLLYWGCFLLFLIGLLGLVTKKNILKMIISILICEYAVNLFIVLIGYRHGAEDPLILKAGGTRLMVDPLPQALVLNTIIVGLAALLVLVSLCVRIYEKYGTLDITEIRKLKG